MPKNKGKGGKKKRRGKSDANFVVRELIGGIYFGQPRGQITNTKVKKAFNTMVYDSKEVERITEVAIKNLLKNLQIKINVYKYQ